MVHNKVTQLLAIEALDFGNVPRNFFSIEVLLSLGGFLSHFLFWPFFGPFVIYAALPIFTFVVSCEACGVPIFFEHGIIFHALCNLHHLLTSYKDLTPLQSGVANLGV